MSSYIAPIREMLFAMNSVGELDRITALPVHAECSPDLVEAVLDEAGRFAAEVLAPLNPVGDREGCQWRDGRVTTPTGFAQAYQQFCAAGWNGMPAPAEFGGQGLPALVSMAVGEMWKSANHAFSLCQMLTLGAINALVHHGSDAQKARWLPPMVEGRWSGTMNLTEPGAGSDLSAISARALPDGDRYRLFGTKIFITWGEHDCAENIVHLVLARLPDAPPGVKGISLFLVPKFLLDDAGRPTVRNDLMCASIEHKLGIHGSPTAVMVFGDNDGASGELVGQPHHGLQYMFTMMNHARLNVGLEGVALAERATQKAVRYARERVQSRPIGSEVPAPIIRHPDVRRMLLSMKARTEAMRALACYSAGQLDLSGHDEDEDARAEAHARVDFMIPIVKAWCTEHAVDIASTGIQVHGGMGYIEETGAAQFLRDARITTIYEGTTGIQANDLIGRKLARDNGRTARELLSDVRRSARQLLGETDVRLANIGIQLQDAADEWYLGIEWLCARHASDPAATAAGAVPFLHLSGLVLGAWLLARQAAQAKAAETSDPAFMGTRIALAQFFADHYLPQTIAYCESLRNGSDSVLALDEDCF